MSAHHTGDDSSASGRARLEAAHGSRAGPAVLVVDDDLDVLASIQQLLIDAGYPTVTADSGADALALLGSGFRPLMVLVDLMMPRMDGWELIGEIRSLGLPITIVSMTAGDRLMEAPVSAAYLQKPLQWEDLVRTVARHCGPPRPRPLDPVRDPGDAGPTTPSRRGSRGGPR